MSYIFPVRQRVTLIWCSLNLWPTKSVLPVIDQLQRIYFDKYYILSTITYQIVHLLPTRMAYCRLSFALFPPIALPPAEVLLSQCFFLTLFTTWAIQIISMNELLYPGLAWFSVIIFATYLTPWSSIYKTTHPNQRVIPSPKGSFRKISSSFYGYVGSTHLLFTIFLSLAKVYEFLAKLIPLNF